MLDASHRLGYRVVMRMMPKHSLPVTALPSAALPAALLAAAVVALAPHAALAQTDAVTRPEAIAESVLRPYSVRQMRSSESAMPLPEAEPEPADNGRAPRDYSWMKGAVQVVEQPRDPVTGAYKRPKIIVGLPSDAMKSWLKSGGITAERCLLPMVRARARVNEEGEASGALWLYARCTFQ